MTFAVTEPERAGRRRRHKNPRPTNTTSASNDEHNGEDVLAPLILIPTPRMSKSTFNSNTAGGTALSSVGSPYLPSPTLSSPYSINSPPPRISSTRSQNDYRDDHHFQTYNQIEAMQIRYNGQIDEDDEDGDSKSKTSFLSEASKKLKQKLNAKQGRKSWHGEGWRDHHNNGERTKTVEAAESEYSKTADVPISKVRRQEVDRARIKKEKRDPSPTHDDGDDEEYYNNYRYRPDRQRQNSYNHHNHHHRTRGHGHHDFNEEEGDEDDDGEYTHNDGSTLSTNSTPTPRSLPLQKQFRVVKNVFPQEEVVEVKKYKEQYDNNFNTRIEIQSEKLQSQQQEQPQQPQHWQRSQQQAAQRRQHHRDHPPSSPLHIVVGSSHPQSPGGKRIEGPQITRHDVKSAEVQESTIRQPPSTDLIQQCRIPREVMAKTTPNTIEMVQTDLMDQCDNANDDKNCGPTTFAEKKEFIMNTLNVKKEMQKQQQSVKEMPPNVVKKEDSTPAKQNAHHSDVNRSSIMNELIAKFGKKDDNDNRTDMDKLASHPSQQRNVKSIKSTRQKIELKQEQPKQQTQKWQQTNSKEVITTVVKEGGSSPTVHDRTSPTKSTGHHSKESSHRSGIMAELISKFGKDEIHVNADKRGLKMKSNPGHKDSPSKPCSSRDNNETPDVPSPTKLSTCATSKQSSDDVMRKENEYLALELHRMKEKLSKQEKEMNAKVTMLEHELRKQKHEVKHLQQEKKLESEAKDDARLHEYAAQLSADLDSYKAECASYRERILQKEREIAKMESFLYEEKKKVLSLESETQMLLNIAEDNASHATSTDRAKDAELAAYREECDKYRKRVLELERKVLATEGALDSTGHIASALEEERNTMSAQLIRLKSVNDSIEIENETLRSKLDEKDSKIEAIDFELSSLQSRWSAAQTTMVDAKGDADENRKSMSILECENASLMHRLEKLQTIVSRCNHVEEENLALKKLNIDLTERQVEMAKEILDAKSLASNTNRLQKLVQESESYISKLQDELAEERTTHLESVQNTRQKYNSDMTALTEKLRSVEESTRIAELKNFELEEKLISAEKEQSELRELESHQSKSQSDQMIKLMEHADDLRSKNLELQDENASLKSELSEMEHAHDVRVKEYQREFALLEEEKMKIADSLAVMKRDLLQARKEKELEMEELGRHCHEKDEALAKLSLDFDNLSLEKSSCVNSLGTKIQQLQQSLDNVLSQNNSLESNILAIQRNAVNVFSLVRREKTDLLSFVKNQILEEKEVFMKQQKAIALKYGYAVEKQMLDMSVKNSITMSIISSEKGDLERLLWAEKEKTSNIEASLTIAREDSKTLTDACAKLSVSEKESFVEAIDNIVLDSSNANFQVKTLEVDVADLTSIKADLEDKISMLSSQLEEKENLVRKLELELEKGIEALRFQLEENKSLKLTLETQKAETNRVVEQMRASFDADRKSQDIIVDEIISVKEGALCREQALLAKVDVLTKEAECHNERMHKIEAILDESNQERDEVAAKYEASRQEVACLLDKTLTSQAKADELTTHYMKIEDQLRQQLQSVQGEKTSLERKLKVVQRESGRLLNELYTEKHDLTSSRASQDDVINELETQVDDLTRSVTETREKCENLSQEVTDLRQHNSELIEKYNCVCTERDLSFEASTGEIERLGNELKAMMLRIEEERHAHASAVAEIQSVFNIEMDQQASNFKAKEKRIQALTCEAKQLGEEVERLKETKEEQKRQISQLKVSLKSAQEEAHRLGSKVASEQDELLKVTHSIVSFEEENSHLKQSLEKSRNEFVKVATFLGLHEPDLSDLETTIQKLVDEKTRLEKELSSKEEKIFNTMNTLTHYEIKLVRAEQERDAQSERAASEIDRLQNELSSVVTKQQLKETDLKSQIVGLKKEWQEKEKEFKSQIVALKREWQEKETEMKSQIGALKKDCEVEYVNNQLYREQLGKIDDNEVAINALNEELHRLRKENGRLTRVTFDITAKNESLGQQVEALAVANEQLAAKNLSLSENLDTVKNKIHCVRSKIDTGKCDDWSMKSSDSKESHVKKTAIELQSTVKAIKKHHDETVKKLQGELDDARKRLKKYECKVCDLTTLIEENAVVIESLHQKLRGKSSTHISKQTASSPRQSYSVDSEVTE